MATKTEKTSKSQNVKSILQGDYVEALDQNFFIKNPEYNQSRLISTPIMWYVTCNWPAINMTMEQDSNNNTIHSIKNEYNQLRVLSSLFMYSATCH